MVFDKVSIRLGRVDSGDERIGVDFQILDRL